MNNEKRNGPWPVRGWDMLSTLLRSVPAGVTAAFLAAVVAMNFLARYTLVSLPYLALNAGIFVSWVTFLLMDVVTRHYGARAANILSLLAVAVNLAYTLLCLVISRIWSYPALDSFVGGQWSILLASTIAYIASALVNNGLNELIGGLFRNDPNGKAAFAARSYGSTLLSQIVDNFLFVWLAFVVFPNIPGALPVRWTMAQCVGCSLTCAVFELATEMVFSPIGYYVVKKWRAQGTGREYISKYCPHGVV